MDRNGMRRGTKLPGLASVLAVVAITGVCADLALAQPGRGAAARSACPSGGLGQVGDIEAMSDSQLSDLIANSECVASNLGGSSREFLVAYYYAG